MVEYEMVRSAFVGFRRHTVTFAQRFDPFDDSLGEGHGVRGRRRRPLCLERSKPGRPTDLLVGEVPPKHERG